jgi:glycosyltransferase involved in cell wall biosynthesis
MRILVVHEVSYRNKVVYEYQDFAERLAAMGHSVTVVDYDDAGDGVGRSERISRTGIAEVSLENIPFSNIPVAKYLSGRLNYERILAKKLKAREIDVVFLYSVFINGTNTVRMCKRYGVPVVYRVLDVYHKVRQNALIMLPLYLGEKYIYEMADRISVTNEKMKHYVRGMRLRPGKDNISVLEHGVDTEFFSPREPDKELMKQYDISCEDSVALFLGTLYPFSGLDVVLSQFAAIKREVPRLKIMVVGGGELEAALVEQAKAAGLEKDFILTGFQPYAMVPRFLSLAKVCFNSFYINDITKDIIPIKMLQYVAAGKAVVCAPIPDVMRRFPEETSGMIFAPIEQPEAFGKALARVLADDAYAAKLGAQGRAYVDEHFSINVRMKALEAELMNAVAEHSHHREK